jgi:hypothetical protein
MESKTAAAFTDLSTLEQSPAIVDQVVRSAMNTISDEHQLRADGLQLERQRLSAKYGPDSPQAKDAAARVGLHDQMKVGIKVQTERLNLRTPEPTSDSFIVYGRVLNSEGDGLEGLVVAAVDQKGQAIGRSDTDDQGVFELAIRDAGVAPQGSSGAIEATATSAAPDSQTELLLQVSDRRNRTLYRDQESFQLAAGRLSYREIVLSQQPQNPKAGSTAGLAT